eukprot:CAMPEP_0170386086 /NCGR_PEP_ID=MMETSP0117_2-20130122/16848_1 /TAXON_ID=400756 /ORGANISM="Durinskia baltica, Strain CSIRO CS-38" /LENGTH=130 /DNA_ID=CAMNT_0010641887 /DNA_START=61 /DNA_END=450 /DNA_ORIENTATION=+
MTDSTVRGTVWCRGPHTEDDAGPVRAVRCTTDVMPVDDLLASAAASQPTRPLCKRADAVEPTWRGCLTHGQQALGRGAAVRLTTALSALPKRTLQKNITLYAQKTSQGGLRPIPNNLRACLPAKRPLVSV